MTTSAAVAFVLVDVVDSDGRPRPTTAQATACPHLGIVASVHSERGFTGGFTAVHIPTGRVLPALELMGHEAGPAAVLRAVDAVAHLDWSSADHDHYRADRSYVQEWARALRHLVGSGADLFDHEEMAEVDIPA